jgi:kelch-like protein 17 (actinfilin)
MSHPRRVSQKTFSELDLLPILSGRSTHEVVEIDGLLYALGGNDGSSSLNSVERYDPKLNRWTLTTSMLTRRSSVGAAVLDCLDLEKGIATTKNI